MMMEHSRAQLSQQLHFLPEAGDPVGIERNVIDIAHGKPGVFPFLQFQYLAPMLLEYVLRRGVVDFEFLSSFLDRVLPGGKELDELFSFLRCHEIVIALHTLI